MNTHRADCIQTYIPLPHHQWTSTCCSASDSHSSIDTAALMPCGVQDDIGKLIPQNQDTAMPNLVTRPHVRRTANAYIRDRKTQQVSTTSLHIQIIPSCVSASSTPGGTTHSAVTDKHSTRSTIEDTNAASPVADHQHTGSSERKQHALFN